MLENCSNCGGKLEFSPKDKGNKCESCGAVLPITYNYTFKKKPFERNIPLKVDNFTKSVKNIKCKSCGASVMLNKFQAQTNCPYCGNSTIVESKAKGIMYIDSIVPFTFNKAEALTKFKHEVNKRFYANKKIFKHIKENDVNGAYINAFVFDMATISSYSGVFSYTETKTNSDGESETKTLYKTVHGMLEKNFKNLTVEANSNLNQAELMQIMPFEYASAVEFKEDFMHGYMLEYEDKMFNDCVKVAEKIIRNELERELLKQYNCDKIESLSMNTNYIDRKYIYCLLPVYFVNTVHKDKKYQVLMNGQTAKIGKLPKDKWRIFLTVLLACGIVTAIILLIVFGIK